MGKKAREPPVIVANETQPCCPLGLAPGPITSWEIDGETVETVSDFILGGSKITADGDCRHEIK